MERKIYQKLKEWKERSKGDSALLIDGARRVGKSYIVKEFAQNEYKSYILIDFLISKNKKVSPIEVKSSSYTKHSSLSRFIDKFSSKLGEKYILYQKDIMLKDGVYHLPVYMAMFL